MHQKSVLSLPLAGVAGLFLPGCSSPIERNLYLWSNQVIEADRLSTEASKGYVTGEQINQAPQLKHQNYEAVVTAIGEPYRELPPQESYQGQSSKVYEYRIAGTGDTNSRFVVGVDSQNRVTGYGYRYGYQNYNDRSLPDQAPYRLQRSKPPAPQGRIPVNESAFQTGRGDICPPGYLYLSPLGAEPASCAKY